MQRELEATQKWRIPLKLRLKNLKHLKINMTPAQKSIQVIAIKLYHGDTPAAFCLSLRKFVARFSAGLYFSRSLMLTKKYESHC